MKHTKLYLNRFAVCIVLAFFFSISTNAQSDKGKPIRLAVAGITHGHVPWILGKKDKSEVVVVGIYEQDKALSQRYAQTYNLSPDLFYTDLNKMLDAVKPQAVVAFGSVN